MNISKRVKFRMVKRAIDEWDPIGLLDYCPSDEYDLESREIADYWKPGMNVTEVAGVINDVINVSFYPYCLERRQCLAPAMRIKTQEYAYRRRKKAGKIVLMVMSAAAAVGSALYLFDVLKKR